MKKIKRIIRILTELDITMELLLIISGIIGLVVINLFG